MQDFLGSLENPGQADATCPLFLHLKHSPFLAHHLHSLRVNLGSLTMSTSMALGSLVWGEEEKF